MSEFDGEINIGGEMKLSVKAIITGTLLIQISTKKGAKARLWAPLMES